MCSGGWEICSNGNDTGKFEVAVEKSAFATEKIIVTEKFVVATERRVATEKFGATESQRMNNQSCRRNLSRRGGEMSRIGVARRKN